MSRAITGRKQTSTHENWLVAMETVQERVSRQHYEDIRGRTVERISRAAETRRLAFGWSGGKDSQAIRVVAEAAGVTDCVLVISDLEYPAFLAWATEQMPDGLEVISTGQDLAWLATHREMLFPQTAAIAAKWFRIVQHTGQRRYYLDHHLDAILLGRRRMDGNFVGKDGMDVYRSKGITRWSPIADWTHDEVLACIAYEQMPLPPAYTWPRGFRVGTGSWPARQYCEAEDQGWREVYTIDPTIVQAAAATFPGAARLLADS